MAEIFIHVGRAGVGKTQQMLESISSDTRGKKHIILTPEQLSHGLERRLCQVGGDSISLKGEVLTFSRICHHVFRLTGGGQDFELEQGGRMILLHRAVEKARTKLKVLQDYAHHPTFYEKLMRTIDELKSNRVEIFLLLDFEENIKEQDKIQDIALIASLYESYTNNLDQHQRQQIADLLEIPEWTETKVGLDPRDRMTRLARGLQECNWAEGKVFWVDGFADFTPQQMEVLIQLMKDGSELHFNFTGDMAMEEEVHNIFDLSFQSIRAIEEVAKKEQIPVTRIEVKGQFPQDDPLRGEALAYIEENFFQPQPEVYTNSVQDELKVYMAQNPRSEVEWVASQIRQLVQSGKKRYRDILVVARNFSGYRKQMETVFPRYQIPYFASEMSDFLDKPVISMVVQLFQAMNSGFASEDMLHYLKTGFSPLSFAEVEEIELYLRKWGNLSWVKPWTRHTVSFDGNITRKQLEEWKNNQSPDYNEKLAQFLENKETLVRLNQWREKAIQPLLQWKKEGQLVSGKEHCQNLYQFFRSVSLPEAIAQRQEILWERGEHSESLEYRQLWDILCRALERSHTLFTEDDMDFSEFAKVFTLVLSQYSVGTIPVSLDQVTAGDTIRMKHHRADVVFWLGCEDSTVPMVSDSGGLFSDLDRALMKLWNVTLNQQKEQLLYREMTTIYELLALPRRQLFISYPVRGPEGGSYRPSFVVTRLLSLCSDLVLEKEDSEVFRLPSPQNALDLWADYPYVEKALEQLEGTQWPSHLAEVKEKMNHERGNLSSLGVNLLYGKGVQLSATSVNKINSCPFSYFAHYSLGLRLVKPLHFDSLCYGNMVHLAMSELLQGYINVQEGKKSFSHYLSKVHVHQWVMDYIQNQLGGIENKTARERFLFQRLEVYLDHLLCEVEEEMRRSEFAYLGGETEFRLPLDRILGKKLPLPVTLRGTIDRVDGYYQQDKGLFQFHVVDYKTGATQFQFDVVYQGREIQLPLYYIALQHTLGGQLEGYRQVWEKEHTGWESPQVCGAALTYLPAKTHFKLDSDELQGTNPSPRKNVKHAGIYVNNNVVLKKMESSDRFSRNKYYYRYNQYTSDVGGTFYGKSNSLISSAEMDLLLFGVRQTLDKVTTQLSQGVTTATPYYYNEKQNACVFCDHKAVCQFMQGRGKDRQNLQSKKSARAVFVELNNDFKKAMSRLDPIIGTHVPMGTSSTASNATPTQTGQFQGANRPQVVRRKKK